MATYLFAAWLELYKLGHADIVFKQMEEIVNTSKKQSN